LPHTLFRTAAAPLLAAVLLVPTATVHAAGADRTAKGHLEIVESTGLNIPNPLVPQGIESFVDESVTTSTSGTLLVTKSVNLTASCSLATSGIVYFLMVDDVPIRNSAVFSRDGVASQLTGVTTGIVEAGTHAIRVGEVCTQPGATVSGGTVTVVGITSIVVLP